MMSDRRITRKPTTRTTRPLSIWVIAVLYGFVFVSIFDGVATAIRLPEAAAFVTFNEDRIDRFSTLVAQNPTDLKLVVLGNSTMKYGTDIDHGSMTFPGVDGVRVLRIVNNRAHFSDFDPLVEDILELQPDLILFQADLLGRERLLKSISKPALLQDYLKWQVAGDGSWNPTRVDQTELQVDQVDYNDQSEARFERRLRSLNEWQTINLDGADAKRASGFIERSARQGIPVILHYTPVTARAAPQQERMAAQLRTSVVRLTRVPGVSLLEYPSPMPLDCFGDFVHMNQKGRKVYMSWLVPELVARASSFDNEVLESFR